MPASRISPAVVDDTRTCDPPASASVRDACGSRCPGCRPRRGRPRRCARPFASRVRVRPPVDVASPTGRLAAGSRSRSRRSCGCGWRIRYALYRSYVLYARPTIEPISHPIRAWLPLGKAQRIEVMTYDPLLNLRVRLRRVRLTSPSRPETSPQRQQPVVPRPSRLLGPLVMAISFGSRPEGLPGPIRRRLAILSSPDDQCARRCSGG